MTQVRKHTKKGSTLALKFIADATTKPKQRYQWSHKKDLCSLFKRNVTGAMTDLCESLQGFTQTERESEFIWFPCSIVVLLNEPWSSPAIYENVCMMKISRFAGLDFALINSLVWQANEWWNKTSKRRCKIFWKLVIFWLQYSFQLKPPIN